MFPLKRGLGLARRFKRGFVGLTWSIAAFRAAFHACSQGGVLAYRNGKGNSRRRQLSEVRRYLQYSDPGRETDYPPYTRSRPGRKRAGKRDSSFFDSLLRTAWPSARRAPKVATAAGPGAATPGDGRPCRSGSRQGSTHHPTARELLLGARRRRLAVPVHTAALHTI